MPIGTALVPISNRAFETTDVHVINNVSLEGLWSDWLFQNGQLDESQALANIVKVALLTDARAPDDWILPDPDDDDRRGWWGDYQAEDIWDGWPIGCRNWLFARSKIVDSNAQEGSTMVKIEQSCRDALQELVDKKICSFFDVVVERVGIQRIDAIITIYRGPRLEISLRFQDLWTAIRES